MSFIESIKKINEEFRGILPENIVHFCDELVEIQLEATHKTLDSADKHKIDHPDALSALCHGFYGLLEYQKNLEADLNTCKDTECPFYCPKQDCVAKEGCAGYTPETPDSWKESVMKHFVEGE